MEECDRRFSRDDFKDKTGCLKPDGHDGPHICKTENDTLIAWEYEYGCKCGCWKTDDYADVCIVYWEVQSM